MQGLQRPHDSRYQAKDPGVDTDKANDIVRQVTELQANNAFRIPGEVQTAAK